MTPSRAEVLADIDGAGIPAWMAEQIAADAAAGRFARWGRSTVVDENTREPVLSRELFDGLHELAGLGGSAGEVAGAGADAGIAWPIGNAGLLHVYGYLLSTVETPYGRKRDRWLDGGVARAFGLPADAFAPWFVTPSAVGSTPLERITAVAEAFAADPADGDFTELWIDETGGVGSTGAGATGAGSTGAAPTLARAVVVRDEDSAAAALLYAVRESGGSGAGAAGSGAVLRLVTLFALEGFGPDWLENELVGSPRLRYNAVDERNATSAPLVDREVTLRSAWPTAGGRQRVADGD